MSSFVSSPQKHPPTFDLFAAVQHHGGVGGGHYTSVCLNRGQWLHYNDSHVQECSPTSLSSSYVLFFAKRGVVESGIRKQSVSMPGTYSKPYL